MSYEADVLFGRSDAKYVAAMRADPTAEWKARAEKAEAELAEAIEQRDKATAAMLAYEEAEIAALKQVEVKA